MADRGMVTRGGIYGPQAGPAGITDAGAVPIIYRDSVLHEGNPPAPVTDKIGNVQVGQFTLAEAAIGLILLIVGIFYMDKVIG